jgi:hypothetical protein
MAALNSQFGRIKRNENPEAINTFHSTLPKSVSIILHAAKTMDKSCRTSSSVNTSQKHRSRLIIPLVSLFSSPNPMPVYGAHLPTSFDKSLQVNDSFRKQTTPPMQMSSFYRETPFGCHSKLHANNCPRSHS